MIKKYLNDVLWVLGFIFVFILCNTSVASFYLVPSTSMQPNILPGDRVLLNKLRYGLWLPLSNKPVIQWAHPRRGEIVFFTPPAENETFIKRVIGLPGDVVSFKNGAIIVNGQQLTNKPVSKSSSLVSENSLILEENKDLQLTPHLILMSNVPSNTYFEQRTFTVPPNKVFVLGDNRDSSIDSRVFGFIDEDTLYGGAVFVLFSTTGSPSFFPEFRIERFLKSID